VEHARDGGKMTDVVSRDAGWSEQQPIICGTCGGTYSHHADCPKRAQASTEETMDKLTDKVIRHRTVSHLRYWREHNTFGMGEHDLGVLQAAIDLIDGLKPEDCPVPLPPTANSR
jgi:hypothetical protein